MRTADDIIARAEADSRGVALIPLSEAGRDISLRDRRPRRACGCKQIKPKPHAVERADALPALDALLCARPRTSRLIWLSDGVDLGRGAEFVAGARARWSEAARSPSIDGGLADRACARRRRQRRRRADREGAARRPPAAREAGIDPRARPQGPAARRSAASRSSDGERETDAEIDLPVEIRNDIARLEIAGRALGRRGATARQALAPPHRRRRLRRDRRHRAAAARLDLLSRARAQPVRRRAAGRARLAGARRCASFIEQSVPMMILADVGNVAGEARERLTALGRGRRRAGALRRPAARRLRRRSRAGEAAPRRPHARRQPELGQAAAARGVLARKPVRRHAGAERRHRHAARCWPSRTPALTERTWATLADGTPLVTAATRGKGMIVLFHVTADTRWSDLPLSGAFVEMLKRIVALAGSTATTDGDGQAPRRARGGAADPHPRRLRRVRPAAADRAAGAGRLCRPRHRRPSARLLRPAGRTAGGQHAGARRPAGAARLSRRSMRAARPIG